MARTAHRLTVGLIPRLGVGTHFDGSCGLFLRVFASGRRAWGQRFVLAGRRHEAGLGTYPVVTLAAARSAAMRNRLLLERGVHPLAPASPRAAEPTLEEAARRAVAARARRWTSPRTAPALLARLERYVFPSLGSLLVSDLRARDFLAIIEPVQRVHPKTAELLREHLRLIMAWVVARGYRPDNPAGRGLVALLCAPPRQIRHQPRVPFAEVGAAVRAVYASRSAPIVVWLFEFLVLTAVRGGEARGALWREVDLDARLWAVPAARVKTRRDLFVPLSGRAVALLGAARAAFPDAELVFPAPRGRGACHGPLLLNLLRGAGVGAVPHGFRSSFRDWCVACDVDHDVAEACLGHVVGSSVARRYDRSNRLELRRPVMEAWAEYVGETSGPPSLPAGSRC